MSVVRKRQTNILYYDAMTNWHWVREFNSDGEIHFEYVISYAIHIM